MSKPQGLQGWDNVRGCNRKHTELLQCCSPTQLLLAHFQRGKHLIFRSRCLKDVSR